MELQRTLLDYIFRNPMGFLERMAYLQLQPEKVTDFNPREVDWNQLLGRAGMVPETDA